MSFISSQFASIPISQLIANPIKGACESQKILAYEFIDYVEMLAFNDDGSTRLLQFNLDQTVTDSISGQVKTMPIKVKAPLLGLVPIPSLLIDEVTVNFTMDITTSAEDKSKQEASVEVKGGYFGVSVTAKASASRESTRKTDQTAKYEVNVKAVQQPPAEGMNKLMDVMASCITPIPAGSAA